MTDLYLRVSLLGYRRSSRWRAIRRHAQRIPVDEPIWQKGYIFVSLTQLLGVRWPASTDRICERLEWIGVDSPDKVALAVRAADDRPDWRPRHDAQRLAEEMKLNDRPRRRGYRRR